MLNQCGKVGVLTEKERDVDFKGRPYNGIVCGTSWDCPGCGSAGDGLPLCSAVQESSRVGPHVVWENGRGLGEKQVGALISLFFLFLTSFVLALRKRSWGLTVPDLKSSFPFPLMLIDFISL